LKRFSSLTLIVSLALVAGACGRSGGGGSTTTQPTTAPPTSVGAGDFGTLKAVCGPGTASGATDKFVTDTTIDVGTMADPGAQASPGLDQELFDTATGFVKWCNAAGGILGRKLNLHLHDAKLFEVPARMIDACNADFALVGGGTAFDDSGVKPRVACGLPEIPGYNNTPAAAEAALLVQGDPLPTQQIQVAGYLGAQKLFPGAKKIAFITGNLASVTVTAAREREGAEQAGLTTVYDQTYPILGAIWRPFVQKMKDANPDFVTYTGDSLQIVAMEQAMQVIGWYPKAIIEAANIYDNRIIKEGKDAIQNLWVINGYYPFEEAKNNPATQQYLDNMAKFNPSGKIATLGLNAWSAWLLFATAARDCGSALTRQCLLQKAGMNAAWTAGGLKAASNTDPNNRHVGECYIAMKGSASGWTRDPQFLVPNQSIYNCDPANVVRLKHNYIPSS
jgi:ABC-type branched-subunit amino acid transport system substrate-binding protein